MCTLVCRDGGIRVFEVLSRGVFMHVFKFLCAFASV